MGDMGFFTESLAFVEIIPECSYQTHDPVDRRTEYGFIDKTGKMVLSKLGSGSWFSEGLASIRVNGKYGYMDRWGKIVIQPQFESAQSFYQGLAEVVTNEKIGFIDKTGTVVINQPKGFYITCCNYSEGMTTIISKSYKYGYR